MSSARNESHNYHYTNHRTVPSTSFWVNQCPMERSIYSPFQNMEKYMRGITTRLHLAEGIQMHEGKVEAVCTLAHSIYTKRALVFLWLHKLLLPSHPKLQLNHCSSHIPLERQAQDFVLDSQNHPSIPSPERNLHNHSVPGTSSRVRAALS